MTGGLHRSRPGARTSRGQQSETIVVNRRERPDQQHVSFTVHTKFNETSVAGFC
jgi:hypothetical protein